MSAKKENVAIVGVGIAACAVCCAGPILGFLAAIGIGIGTLAGFAVFGAAALLIGAVAVAVVVVLRRRRRAQVCSDIVGPVTVDEPVVRTPR
jgi:mercuric ion transport protein